MRAGRAVGDRLMSAYFERTTVSHGGRPSRGFKIQCGYCKFNGAVPVEGNLSAENETKLIRRKFEAIGWKIGIDKGRQITDKRHSRHACDLNPPGEIRWRVFHFESDDAISCDRSFTP